MIDLSFLTEEEQESILAVLQRDAKLKKTEEQRVQKLQRTLRNKSQLRYLTGEWFYETKQRRHRERIHGSDLIRASMRRTYKPLTIVELTKIFPEEPSFVCSDNKEVFVPAVLSGLLREPRGQVCTDRCSYKTPQEPHKACLQSPTKQRKNPFNSDCSAWLPAGEKDGQAQDGAEDERQKQINELWSDAEKVFDAIISDAISNQPDPSIDPFAQETTEPAFGKISSVSQDGLLEWDSQEGIPTNGAAPRGILKYLPTSADNLFCHTDPQSPVVLTSPAESWLDRKQVRFSSGVALSRAEWQDGKELGEHGLLDEDPADPVPTADISEIENEVGRGPRHPQDHAGSNEDPVIHQHLQKKLAGRREVQIGISVHSQHQEPLQVLALDPPAQESNKTCHTRSEPEEDGRSQSTDRPLGRTPQSSSKDISLNARSDNDPSSNSAPENSIHGASPKPKRRLLGIFRSQKERLVEVLKIPKKEQLVNDLENTAILPEGAADRAANIPARTKEEAKLPEMTEVRTLQLTALQKTQFKDIMDSVNSDTQRRRTEGNVPESQSSTDSEGSTVRENTDPKLKFIRAQATREDVAETWIRPNVRANSDKGGGDDTLSACAEVTGHVAAAKAWGEYASLVTECAVVEDLASGDGTYRADPVMIDEETDDSLSDTEIQQPKECIPSQEDSTVAIPQHANRTPQEHRPANISDLKQFWEREYVGQNLPNATGKEVLDTRQPSEGGGKTKEEELAQTPPRNSGFSKLLGVTDQGFVSPSPERSPQRNCEVPRMKTPQVSVGSQERSLSPSRFQYLKSKQQEDEVRKSPSKTCHPRVLPRESLSPKKSRLEGSPLKTFPIDIDPQVKVPEEQAGKPTPAPRQRKSPSHEARQSIPVDNKPSTETTSSSPESHLKENESYWCGGSSCAAALSSGTVTCLARSFIPQDFQHYLGPNEKAYVPPFCHEKESPCMEVKDGHGAQNADGSPAGYRGDGLEDGNLPESGSWKMWSKVANSGREVKSKTQSLTRASSGSHHDDKSGKVMSALKRLSLKSVSSSKSLDNLTSSTREKRSNSNSTEEISGRVQEAASIPTSKEMTASVSVPALQLDEMDSDSTFESSLGWRRNTGSSTSNISLSSGMASMSSVSGSISSIYPADFGDVEIQGSIQFAVNYIQKMGEFHIFVVMCRDLAVADAKKSRSDPYVKCYLLPDKTKLGKRKTSIKKRTLNPTYNEILRFKINMEVMKTQSLNISVWHNDTFGRNSFLGEVDLEMSEWDFSNTQINEYALKARVSGTTPSPAPPCLTDSRGQMRVALRFLPQTSHSKRHTGMETGEVQIWVKDCKNLPPVRGVVIDPFVKCAVLPDTSRRSRQKTRVVKRTANPMFNHTMVYDGFRRDDLQEACVEITVWDHDRLHNHYIGGLRLGLGTGKSYGVEVLWMDSTKDEANLWQKMLQSGGEWVEGALPLRMLEMAKSMSK